MFGATIVAPLRIKYIVAELLMKTADLIRAFYVFAVLATLSFVAAAQSTPVKPSLATGDVVSVDAAKIVLQTKDGVLNVLLSDKTEYKRVSPENPSLKTATPAAFGDIGVGDKLVVSGIMSDDKRSLPARSVYLMRKTDLTEKDTKEKERWAAGISGRVTSVDQTTGQIKVEVRNLLSSTTVVVTAKPDARFRRYANNSIKFSDAKVSSIGEIEVGDGLRARGDRSTDGASFMADEIISGGFRTIAGDVKSVDVARNEVVITEEQSKKDTTLELGAVVLMKKFPAEIAQRMAAFQGGGQGGPGMRPGGTPPAGGAGTGNGNRPTGGATNGAGGPRGSIDDMLERFPNITAADLKVGEKIAVVVSKSGAGDRMTAFKLLAGIEPFVQLALARAAANGGQRGGQGALSLDIPGLDGFGGP